MEQSTLSIRINSSDKINFEKFCSETGMNVSVAINMFIKAVLRDQKLPFEIKTYSFDNYVYKADDVVNKYVDSDLFLITAGKYLLNQIHINPIFLNPRYFHGSFKLNGHVTFAKNQIVKSDMLILIGSRTSNHISVFLYDKINKLLYLADQYNKSYF